AVLGGALTYGGSAQGAVNAGVYTITVGGLTSNNYQVSFVPGQLTIDPANLTLLATAADATRRYGAENPLFTGTATGFLAGDTLETSTTGQLIFTPSATPASPVGNYEIVPGGLASTNYIIRFVPGTLSVTPADLTLTAVDRTKVYG